MMGPVRLSLGVRCGCLVTCVAVAWPARLLDLTHNRVLPNSPSSELGAGAADGSVRTRKAASMAHVTSKSKAAPFSAAAAESVLGTACEIAELDRAGARLLRLGENALFHLACPIGCCAYRTHHGLLA